MAKKPVRKASKKPAKKPTPVKKAAAKKAAKPTPKATRKKPANPFKAKIDKTIPIGRKGTLRQEKNEDGIKVLVYRGVRLSEGLTDRIKALRIKYRRAGRFVSYAFIMDWYFQTEDEFCSDYTKGYDDYSVVRSQGAFGYTYVDLVDEGTSYLEYQFNAVKERVMQFVSERGGPSQVRLYIRGVGEDKAKKYGIFAGMEKIDAELAKIWHVIDAMDEYNMFYIPACENLDTGVLLIDFNRLSAPTIGAAKVLNSILEGGKIRKTAKKKTAKKAASKKSAPKKAAPKKAAKKATIKKKANTKNKKRKK